MIVSQRFAAWILGGATLDATVLVLLWRALRALAPWTPLLERPLHVVGLIALPWLVHVLLLPRLFNVTAPELRGIGWLVRSLVWFMAASVLIPVLGMPIFAFFALPWLLVSMGVMPALHDGHDGTHDVVDFGFHAIALLTIILVGAAMGLLLHMIRRGNLSGDAVPPDDPRLRSDVLGGALAAGLVFVTMALVRPPLPPSAIVMIVTFAMLPHVILIGQDLLARLPQSGA